MITNLIEEKELEIDFDGHLLVHVRVCKNQLEFIKAVNGFGESVNMERMSIQEVAPEKDE